MANYPLRETIVDLLVRIEKDKAFSHLLIDQAIKSGEIDKKDEGLLTEIVYGTFQRKLTLEYYLNAFVNPKKKIDLWVRMLLEMSIYQMVFLDKIPDHAIIHEAVEIAKKRGHKGVASFVNGVLRNIQRKGVPSISNINNVAKRIAVETSHPEWLVNRWITMYGEHVTRDMCAANLTRKPLSVRVQPLKISREEAIHQMEEQGMEVRPSGLSDQGIIIEKGNIFATELFHNGYITIQDQSSMLVAEMLDAKSGMVVLDACSAPGGKATHIAEKMQNKGTLYAYDLHAKKAKLIDNKATELDLSIIVTGQSDARQLQSVHKIETFDRILVDAPCSGLGVIRGKPEIKYTKTESDIRRLAKIQLDILNHIAPLLKKDGLLIYSTCTVDREENEDVVKAFLRKNHDYTIDQTFFSLLPLKFKQSIGCSNYGLQIFPQTLQTDGFFLVRFRKK